MEQAALFMFHNGTVLSIFQTQDSQITEPLMERLRVRGRRPAALQPDACGAHVARMWNSAQSLC